VGCEAKHYGFAQCFAFFFPLWSSNFFFLSISKFYVRFIGIWSWWFVFIFLLYHYKSLKKIFWYRVSARFYKIKFKFYCFFLNKIRGPKLKQRNNGRPCFVHWDLGLIFFYLFLCGNIGLEKTSRYRFGAWFHEKRFDFIVWERIKVRGPKLN